MGLTALQGAGLDAGGVSDYRGATTAARFGNPQMELAALREGCGVYDLGYRAKISLTGADRVRWLNGMVTNNIRDLAAGQGLYAFLLNPQGHILGDLYAYNQGESLLVDTDASQLQKILATFDHYIIMDDVEVKSLSEEMTSLGIGGPRARDVLRAARLEIPELRPLQLHEVQCKCDCGCLNCTFVRAEDALVDSYEIWLAPAHVKPMWDALVKGGAVPVGSEALELQRILAGIPRYGVDIRERDLPQETEQERALSFNKGCYVGQEIVERIRSRGMVHRKFSGFFVAGVAPIVPGAKITVGEKEVGEITSVAALPAADQTIALGYVRRELGAPGREVIIGTTKATVVQLPVEDPAVRHSESSLEKHPA